MRAKYIDKRFLSTRQVVSTRFTKIARTTLSVIIWIIWRLRVDYGALSRGAFVTSFWVEGIGTFYSEAEKKSRSRRKIDIRHSNPNKPAIIYPCSSQNETHISIVIAVTFVNEGPSNNPNSPHSLSRSNYSRKIF